MHIPPGGSLVKDAHPARWLAHAARPSRCLRPLKMNAPPVSRLAHVLCTSLQVARSRTPNIRASGSLCWAARPLGRLARSVRTSMSTARSTTWCFWRSGSLAVDAHQNRRLARSPFARPRPCDSLGSPFARHRPGSLSTLHIHSLARASLPCTSRFPARSQPSRVSASGSLFANARRG
ncbi:MAG: hypothetical protein KatS3mg038_2302 [Candidatus Kapaibacterium sp.]|nr:MAG: hypothetical protein KatS3mg038_2302 [Candidatus Kapabacteria bacterium]